MTTLKNPMLFRMIMSSNSVPLLPVCLFFSHLLGQSYSNQLHVDTFPGSRAVVQLAKRGCIMIVCQTNFDL